MEGVGSRLGRASSRYGQAPVFSGPVRKWKKQWVQVSSPLSYSRSNNNHNNNNAPSLLLCRWTPISSTNSGDNSSVKPEEPPRRKFRYTPRVFFVKNLLDSRMHGDRPRLKRLQGRSQLHISTFDHVKISTSGKIINTDEISHSEQQRKKRQALVADFWETSSCPRIAIIYHESIADCLSGGSLSATSRKCKIVVLDEMKKEFEKRATDEPVTSKISQSSGKETTKSDDIFRKHDIDSLFVDVSQELNNNSMAPGHSNKRLLDMDLCLKGDDDYDDSDGEN